MDSKLIIILAYFIFANQQCKFGNTNLSHFKKLEYNYLFSEIINNSIREDVIYIKDINLLDKNMLMDIQEFVLCYAMSHPDVTIIRISDKNKYPVDEFSANYVKMNIYLNRQNNEITIEEMKFYHKRKRIYIDFPTFYEQPDCQ